MSDFSLLCQKFLKPEFYGDLVFKLKKMVDTNNFSAQFIKLTSHYKKWGLTSFIASLRVGPQTL